MADEPSGEFHSLVNTKKNPAPKSNWASYVEEAFFKQTTFDGDTGNMVKAETSQLKSMLSKWLILKQ